MGRLREELEEGLKRSKRIIRPKRVKEIVGLSQREGEE